MSQIAIERIHGKTVDQPTILDKLENAALRVRDRAQELFERRGGHCNCATQDWLTAERELLAPPEAKMVEKDGKFHLDVAIPGFDAKDVRITSAENELVVEAENKSKEEQEDENVYFCEFKTNNFFRRFEMPAPVDVDRVTAHIEKGVLHITAAKLQPARIHSAAA
jgi:HSP20 family protein